MPLATLSIDLEARLAKLEEGMNKATRVAEKNASAIESRYARIGTAVRSVAGVIATAFAGVSILGFVRETVSGIDALNDLKDATGASIENLSALEDVALRTGTSMEGVSSTLVKFNAVLADAKPGSQASAVLRSIGLDAERLRAIDPAEALRQVAVALSKYADDGNKARIIQELFGKSVREAAPFLNDLAKQTQLVGRVTAQQAEEAEKFNQQLASLAKNSRDSARALIGDLLPALNRLLSEFTAGKEAFGGFFGALGNLGTSRTFDNPLQGLQFYARQLAELREKRRDLEANPGAPVRLAANAQDIENTQKFIRYYERLLELSNSAGAGRGFVSPMDTARPPAPKLPDATPRAREIDEATRALAQYVAQLDKERTVTLELSEEQQALNFLKSLGKRGEIPQVRELVLGLAAEVDARRDAAGMAKLQAEAQRELNKAEAEGQRALEQLLAQTGTARGAALVDVTARLDEAFQRGDIGARQYAEAVEIVDKALEDLTPKVKQAKQDMDEFSKQAARNVQDALGDTVLATLQGRFDSIGRLWTDLVQRMIAQALSARLGELLLGNFGRTGQVGGLFGDFLSLFGLAKGGAFGRDGALQPFAGGGVVSRPTLFRFAGGTGVMGEAGAEAILPLKRGRDGKLGVASAGGGAAQVININVDGGMNRNEVYAAISLAVNALRGEVRQSLRAAGVA